MFNKRVTRSKREKVSPTSSPRRGGPSVEGTRNEVQDHKAKTMLGKVEASTDQVAKRMKSKPKTSASPTKKETSKKEKVIA